MESKNFDDRALADERLADVSGGEADPVRFFRLTCPECGCQETVPKDQLIHALNDPCPVCRKSVLKHLVALDQQTFAS